MQLRMGTTAEAASMGVQVLNTSQESDLAKDSRRPTLARTGAQERLLVALSNCASAEPPEVFAGSFLLSDTVLRGGKVRALQQAAALLSTLVKKALTRSDADVFLRVRCDGDIEHCTPALGEGALTALQLGTFHQRVCRQVAAAQPGTLSAGGGRDGARQGRWLSAVRHQVRVCLPDRRHERLLLSLSMCSQPLLRTA
jgi:hypothetical protein